MSYIQSIEEGDSLDWKKELSLYDHPDRIVSIHVWNQTDKEVGYAVWGWKEDEIKFGKVGVMPEFREQKIGSILMQMVIAIAEYYKATKIIGTIAGKPFLFDWYRKLGFTIYNQNKMVLELNK